MESEEYNFDCGAHRQEERLLTQCSPIIRRIIQSDLYRHSIRTHTQKTKEGIHTHSSRNINEINVYPTSIKDGLDFVLLQCTQISVNEQYSNSKNMTTQDSKSL